MQMSALGLGACRLSVCLVWEFNIDSEAASSLPSLLPSPALKRDPLTTQHWFAMLHPAYA